MTLKIFIANGNYNIGQIFIRETWIGMAIADSNWKTIILNENDHELRSDNIIYDKQKNTSVKVQCLGNVREMDISISSLEDISISANNKDQSDELVDYLNSLIN